MASSISEQWNLIDFSTLDASKLCKLPTKQRQDLYEQITESFTITKTTSSPSQQINYKYENLRNHQIGSILKPISLKTELLSISFFFIFCAMFFIPALFLLIAIYLLINNHFFIFLIYCILYFILIFYPIQENKEFLQNSVFYSILNYFCYRHVIHQECQNYIHSHLHQDQNNRALKPLIFISIPHGILPLSSVLSPLVSPDIFKTAAVGTAASIIFYIPIIRNVAHWYGAKSVSKSSIFKIFAQNKHVGLVCDGIRGMFVKGEDKEVVLLKHRKGVAKLALQSGCHVCPTYGFGNTLVYNGLYDSFGFMQWLSGKLRMSLLLFYGRYGTLVPKRVPLYFVVGKPIYNKYGAIKKPTQQQIDGYHELILKETKELFDAHKAIYGWSHKELVFV